MFHEGVTVPADKMPAWVVLRCPCTLLFAMGALFFLWIIEQTALWYDIPVSLDLFWKRLCGIENMHKWC